MFRCYSMIIVTLYGILFAFQCFGSISGALLASRFSSSLNDFYKSAQYTSYMIEKGNKQPDIYNDALLYSVAAGEFEQAFSLAGEMEKSGLKSPALALTLISEKLKKKEFDTAIQLISKYEANLPEVLKISMRGWIHIQKENFNAAVREFTNFQNLKLNFDLGSYYTSIAYAQLGKYFMSAEVIRNNRQNFEVLGKNYEIFGVNVLSLVDDNINTELLLSRSIRKNSKNLTLKQLHRKIKTRQDSYLEVFKTPNSGIADTLLLFAEGGGRESNQNLIETFYCQLANYITDIGARFNIRLAQALADSGLVDKAIDTLRFVEESDLFYAESKLMLADLLIENSQENLAIKVLKDLIKNGVMNFEVYEALGNVYRHAEKYELASMAYTEALAANKSADFENNNLWMIYFFRGITREQLRDYEKSMEDLGIALEFVPEHPQVLNYLGYMLIERKENLDEALRMIELAVEKSPESGYIVDSLAWGLYQLGRYDEAIIPMEKAISLEPEDPIVNDHFGDILWKVGRKREAKFQWKRALLFNPDKELLLRIKDKLELGLRD